MPRYSGPADVLQTDEHEYVIFLTSSSSQMKFLYAMIDQATNTIAPKLERVVWPRLLDCIYYSACVLKNVLYVTGGREKSSGRYLKRTLKYDPANGRWLECASMKTSRARHAAVGYNGRVFVMGGTTKSNEVTDKCESYEPLTDEWHSEPSLPGPRSDHSVVTHQGLVYVTGGASPTQNANDNVWIMRRHWPDPTKPEVHECVWELLQDSIQNHMTYKLANHSSAVCHDRLFIMGGRGVCLGQTTDGENFARNIDANGGTVSAEDSDLLPAKNFIGTCSILHGCHLGLSYIPPPEPPAKEKCRSKKDSWRSRRKRDFMEPEVPPPPEIVRSRWIKFLPDMPAKRAGAGTVVIGNKIYLVGGHQIDDETGGSVNSSTYFHVKKRQWFSGFSLGVGDFNEVQCVALYIPKSNRDFRPMKYSECKWVLW